MGIKDLRKVLDKCPNAEKDFPLTFLQGKKVAVDGSNWLFRYWKSSAAEVVNNTNVAVEEPSRDKISTYCIFLLCKFLHFWLRNRITPVFVFDGEHPEEKQQAQQKRADDSRKARDKLKECKEKIANMNAFDRNSKVIKELRELYTRCSSPGKEQAEYIRSVLNALGIPVIQADGEGEKLCSCLAVERKVAAVYSNDTDNLVYGTPLLIKDKLPQRYDPEKEISIDYVRVVDYYGMLFDLDISDDSFVDLCIMLGCDYNERIKGIGPVKALKLIKDFSSIEGIQDKHNTSCLKHNICRELFEYVPSDKIMANDWEQACDIDMEAFNEQSYTVLSSIGLENWQKILYDLMVQL